MVHHGSLNEGSAGTHCKLGIKKSQTIHLKVTRADTIVRINLAIAILLPIGESLNVEIEYQGVFGL